VVTDWADRPRSRELCVQALDRWLRFCVHDHGLPAGSWTLSERDSKRFRGRRAEKRVKATLTDLEILQLVEATTHTGWRNALMLLALYGLRPEELNHLQAREHPSTGDLMLFCSYRKTCGQHRGEARWLLPCPLINSHGESVTWQLPGLMKAGLLELPPLGTKYALQTYLRRQPLWHHLSQQAADRGEWLRPYAFRDSYSLRCHRLGIESGAVAAAMGHSLAVHSSSYRWADEAQTALAFQQASS
jgi:integrase